jgi:hypothetical protein
MFISRLRYFLIAGCLLGLVAFGTSSCKKEQLLASGGELRFSTDTLSFDTVFTTMGSATLGIKIYNPQSQKVTVSSVRMARGNSSPFRLNVDGKAGDGSNIEIAANDSVYVFATVKVDPTDENSPFVVEDQLIASLNGNDFSIPVMAYGQNANYIVNDASIAISSLSTEKPWVIIGYAVVGAGRTLTIPAGCRIYMHQTARLYVAGTLTALGTKQDSIIFQGDRLDRSYYGYEGYPGEWGGIYFDSYSTENEMRHVIIRNCGRPTVVPGAGNELAPAAAVQVAPDSVSDAQPQLRMDQCIIENSIGYGLLAFNGTVEATNCLIHSCGANALALVQGGNYKMDNCSFATYGNTKINHSESPVAVLTNFYFVTQTRYISAPLKCTLRNCVVAGSLEDEFAVDSLAGATAEVRLDNCVLKTNPDSIANRRFIVANNLRITRPGNELDPMFVDISKWDYRLKAGSPLIDIGLSGVTGIDLDDQPRPKGAAIDIGAYESF